MKRGLSIEFSDEFRENNIEAEEVRRTIFEAEKRAEEISSTEKDLKIELSWTESDFVVENMHGVHGRTLSSTEIEYNLNTDTEEWRRFLKSQHTHEYAHTIFFVEKGLDYHSNIENWRHVLLEAHSQIFAEKSYPEIRPEWRTKFSEKELAEKWFELRSLMEKKLSDESIFHAERYHSWLGYSLSYYIGRKLMGDHEVEEFPGLEKEDVVEAGNKLFE